MLSDYYDSAWHSEMYRIFRSVTAMSKIEVNFG